MLDAKTNCHIFPGHKLVVRVDSMAVAIQNNVTNNKHKMHRYVIFVLKRLSATFICNTILVII